MPSHCSAESGEQGSCDRTTYRGAVARGSAAAVGTLAALCLGVLGAATASVEMPAGPTGPTAALERAAALTLAARNVTVDTTILYEFGAFTDKTTEEFVVQGKDMSETSQTDGDQQVLRLWIRGVGYRSMPVPGQPPIWVGTSGGSAAPEPATEWTSALLHPTGVERTGNTYRAQVLVPAVVIIGNAPATVEVPARISVVVSKGRVVSEVGRYRPNGSDVEADISYSRFGTSPPVALPPGSCVGKLGSPSGCQSP